MKKRYLTVSPSQTKKLGGFMAKTARENRPGNKAFVLGLEGDLGGGKTTFLQGFAKGLGIKKRVLSPTFIIVRRIKDFYHIDCYRLQKPEELLALGFKKITAEPKNIIVVEWADRVKKIMPQNTIWVSFDFIDKNKRKITIKSKDGE